MNPIDIERAIAVELNLAESELASVAARLAKIDALAVETTGLFIYKLLVDYADLLTAETATISAELR